MALIDSDGAAAGAAVRTWTAYDGDNAYADFNGSAALQVRYLHGPAVDELLARTGDAGTTAWYLTDRLGSVRDVASTAGAVIDHVAYDSYGKVTSETSPGNGDRFKFTGRELDAGTGLQYNRARYYDAAIGRWTQEDPIGFEAGDANLYRYVGNGPTNRIDPFGMDWRGALGGFIEGGSIGLGGGILVGGGVGTMFFPGPGTALGGLGGGILGGVSGAVCGAYRGYSEADFLDGSQRGVRPGLISAAGGGLVGGVTGPAAALYGPEIVAAVSAWASQGAMIAGLNAAQIQNLINKSGNKQVVLFTKLTQSPQSGRLLSCAKDPKLAQAARESGQIFTGHIPNYLYNHLVGSGHIQEAKTLMNGIVGDEIIISQEAAKILAPFFK